MQLKQMVWFFGLLAITHQAISMGPDPDIMDPVTKVKYENLRTIAQQFNLDTVPATEQQKVVDATSKYIASVRKRSMLWAAGSALGVAGGIISTKVPIARNDIKGFVVLGGMFFGLNCAFMLAECTFYAICHTLELKLLNCPTASNEDISKVIRYNLWQNLISGDINYRFPLLNKTDALNKIKFVKRNFDNETHKVSYSPQRWNKPFKQAIHDSENFTELMSGKCKGFQFVEAEN